MSVTNKCCKYYPVVLSSFGETGHLTIPLKRFYSQDPIQGWPHFLGGGQKNWLNKLCGHNNMSKKSLVGKMWPYKHKRANWTFKHYDCFKPFQVQFQLLWLWGVMKRAACCRPRKRQPSTSTVDQTAVFSVDVDQTALFYWSTEKSATVDVDDIFHDLLYGKKCSQIIIFFHFFPICLATFFTIQLVT